ncbi:hypothetical protein [Leifsonia sp. NPDC080035]|uniref:Uncharacterized protein n=1 Tax=Leifsonia sp. NPDC080035 TaxID=3143936 RepID=A0AAU7GAM2_9MICO
MTWQRRTSTGTMGGSGLDLLGRGVAAGAALLMAVPLLVASVLTIVAR